MLENEVDLVPSTHGTADERRGFDAQRVHQLSEVADVRVRIAGGATGLPVPAGVVPRDAEPGGRERLHLSIPRAAIPEARMEQHDVGPLARHVVPKPRTVGEIDPPFQAAHTSSKPG